MDEWMDGWMDRSLSQFKIHTKLRSWERCLMESSVTRKEDLGREKLRERSGKGLGPEKGPRKV